MRTTSSGTLDVCPRRGGRLEDFAGGSGETREIVDCELPRVRRRRIRRRVHHCPHCRKPVRAGIPGVIPKFALPDDVVDCLLRAAKLRRRIEEVVRTEGYSHPSVLNVREMFRDNDDHLWGWAMHPKIPAENNAAERAVRPLASHARSAMDRSPRRDGRREAC